MTFRPPYEGKTKEAWLDDCKEEMLALTDAMSEEERLLTYYFLNIKHGMTMINIHHTIANKFDKLWKTFKAA